MLSGVADNNDLRQRLSAGSPRLRISRITITTLIESTIDRFLSNFVWLTAGIYEVSTVNMLYRR
jgi:hypothetical protein